MAATLEKIYEVALHHYHMKLVAGREGLSNLVDWVHVVEEMDYVHFLKGRELIVTTGIKEPDDAQLLEFTQRVYATGASGLVFNVGRYIRSVPKEVQEFGENNDFPVFVLPWEVHLVDFNRELCNLIYRSEQEQDDLESAIRKAVFSPEKKEEYLPVLAREGIHGDTGLTMVQCYVPASGKTDITSFYYRFLRQCQQILTKRNLTHVVFHHDRYLTLVMAEYRKEIVDQVLDAMKRCALNSAEGTEMYLAVSEGETLIGNLREKYQTLSYLCRWAADKKQTLCRESEIGVTKLLLAVPDRRKLWEYETQTLGELERIDQETGSECLKILKIYLEENGNIQEVAAKCFLHRNTVAYHLKKISEITGKNLGETRNRTQWELAYLIRNLRKLLE